MYKILLETISDKYRSFQAGKVVRSRTFSSLKTFIFFRNFSGSEDTCQPLKGILKGSLKKVSVEVSGDRWKPVQAGLNRLKYILTLGYKRRESHYWGHCWLEEHILSEAETRTLLCRKEYPIVGGSRYWAITILLRAMTRILVFLDKYAKWIN